jgi:hypothetical protein
MLAKIEEQIAAGGVDVKDATQCITSLTASTEGIDGATVALFIGESLTCIASSGTALPKDSVLSSTLGLYAECISSGRMVSCRSATDPQAPFQQDLPTGIHSALVLPVVMGGHIRGILAVFAAGASQLGPGHISVLGTAAEIASLLDADNWSAINARTDMSEQTVAEPSDSELSATQLTPPPKLLTKLLADQEVSAHKRSFRVPLCIFAGLGLVLMCGVLFGGVARVRDLVYRNHENSGHSPQLSTVRLKIGDAVPADSVALSGSKTPKTTGGHLGQQVDPVYPADALRSGIEGDVDAVLVVNKAGIVEQVLISNGDPLLATAAVSALEHWRYSAFYLDNRPVAVSIPVQVKFRSKPPLANQPN